MKLREMQSALGGEIVQGSPDTVVEGIAAPEAASAAHLVFGEGEAGTAAALNSCAAVAVVKPGSLVASSNPGSIAVVEVRNPRLWFARAAKLLATRRAAMGIHSSAVVDPTAKLSADVSVDACAVIGAGASIGVGCRIGAGVVIGEGVVIGSDCVIYPRVVLYPGTTVGNRCVLHSGVVLGADGFGYVRDNADGSYTQFPQRGTLVLEDDVEIGANSTVDRGALKETRIRRGVKMDNLVHVGHNCDIGEDVILVMGTGISGSSTVGKGAVLAGQVGIGDHVTIGPGVILGGQSGVFNGKELTNEGVKPGTVFFGTPARPLGVVMRETAVLARLAKRPAKIDRE